MSLDPPTTRLVEVILPVPLDRSFTYRDASSATDGEESPCPGDLVGVPFGRRKEVTGLVVGVREEPGDLREIDGARLRDVARRHGPEYRIEDDRRALLDWLADYYALPPGEVVPLFHPPSPGTRGRKPRHETAAYPERDDAPPEPTVDQQRALSAVAEHADAGTFGAVLLFGVTGSGKTEVYLRAIADVLARGRSAIVLLPEIALTPQTETRFRRRLGDEVAVIHSGLSAGQRCRVHERAARGEVKVVLGPRSALFAPVRDLGVIVVDEEHETSYKQDEKPRYHARHAALVRARAAGAPVVLGSATPDLESWRNAEAGRYEMVALDDRPTGALPLVEVVDLRNDPPRDGFSQHLLDRMEASLERGRQAIVYFNRRGYARSVQCESCGEVVECPSCDIALTYHLRPRRLLCHYCGFTRPAPDRCPACDEPAPRTGGGGTEKVELALAAQFPDARLLRLDHDTTRRRGSHARILGAFAAREADVLVGTQMVAKGHHFPGVDLVGVLAADDGLHQPDFRAQERAFQLLTQVAGRTGREDPGTVVFQTWQPDHPVVVAASTHDYRSFAVEELGHREAVSYPPFVRMLRVGLTGRAAGAVDAAADAAAALLREGLLHDRRGREGVTVLGPAPAVFPRLQNKHRRQVLLKGALDSGERAWLADCLRTLRERHRGVDVMWDVDPVGLW